MLELLNRRAVCAKEIGEIKKKHGLPIFVPEREMAVIDRLSKQNSGPLSDDAIQELFGVIFSQMKRLEGLSD